jgi:hypothetical protein
MSDLNFPSTLNDISQLIRTKEKELHEIHDQRCVQLEMLVMERDNLLVDSSKRFEQLKDDFQYNLTLIEARDNEIERLEKILKDIKSDLDSSEAGRRILSGRIEAFEVKEIEQNKRHEEGKVTNKVRTCNHYCSRSDFSYYNYYIYF